MVTSAVVRLVTCIALELFVGTVVAAAATIGGYGLIEGTLPTPVRAWGQTLAAEFASLTGGSPEPAALASVSRHVPLRTPFDVWGELSVEVARRQAEHAARLAAAEPPAEPTPLVSTKNVFGADDEVLLQPLRNSPVTELKVNHGGTSLSLRLQFASGARAAFKPEQIHFQSNPRREIAAYRLDRLLGLGRVPPAMSAVFRLDQLLAATPPRSRSYIQTRLANEALPRGEMLYGELSWWVPKIKNATVRGFRVDETEGIVTWWDALRPTWEVPADVRDQVAQISDMVVFDFIIDNSDRWTGSNVKASVDNKSLFFMDNTLSFSTTVKRQRSVTYLKRVGKFSGKLVGALRRLSYDTLVAAMAARDEDAALGPLLTDAELEAVMERRNFVLDYVDSLIGKFGEDKVLAFP